MSELADGSYRTPRAEHARVIDAMRHGVLKCAADASLRDAARTMWRTEHVHMVVVTSPVDGSVLGALSDMALLDGLLEQAVAERPLGELVDTNVQMVSSDAPLREAATAMRDRGVSHVIVRDAHNGHPVGVLSTLDVAGIPPGARPDPGRSTPGARAT